MDEKNQREAADIRPVEYHVEAVAKDTEHENQAGADNVAVKSDDSDGKLDWTARSFMAYVSLCFVYTGVSNHTRRLWSVC
jgi:hypothetical protein